MNFIRRIFLKIGGLAVLLIGTCFAVAGYDWGEAQVLYPGVKYIDVWRSFAAPAFPNGQRAVRVHVLQIDTTTPRLKFYTTPRTANWVINSLEADKQKTKDFISSSHGPGTNYKNLAVAINANFFGSGDPCNVRGLAVSEGVLVSPHATDYSSAFLVNRQGGVSMAETFDNFDISNIQTAISGRPFCVQNGIGQDPYGTGEPRPRTQIGISQDNRYVYFMAIDGDQAASKGVYTIEGGWLLAEFGAWTGITSTAADQRRWRGGIQPRTKPNCSMCLGQAHEMLATTSGFTMSELTPR